MSDTNIHANDQHPDGADAQHAVDDRVANDAPAQDTKSAISNTTVTSTGSPQLATPTYTPQLQAFC